jgi:hypothetical protein
MQGYGGLSLAYQGDSAMPDFYTATLRTSRGALMTLAFAGMSEGQVLYAALELYPDCDVVRICRDGQWGEPAAVDG